MVHPPLSQLLSYRAGVRCACSVQLTLDLSGELAAALAASDQVHPAGSETRSADARPPRPMDQAARRHLRHFAGCELLQLLWDCRAGHWVHAQRLGGAVHSMPLRHLRSRLPDRLRQTCSRGFALLHAARDVQSVLGLAPDEP